MSENIRPVPYTYTMEGNGDKLEGASMFRAQKPKKTGLSLEEKIKEKKVNEDAIWNLVESNGLVYTFDFIFETIVFDVHVADSSGNVQKIVFYSQFCETNPEPTIILAHNLLKRKLNKKYILSALGQQPYDILSLLDLITMMGDQMIDALDELNELGLRYGLVIDKDLKAHIQFLDLQLPIGLDVTINTNNFEHITVDDVHVKVIAGKIDYNEIKKLVNGCTMGIHFLRNFIDNVEAYINFLKTIN